MLAHQTDHFQHVVDLFVNHALVLFAADHQALGDGFVHGHARIQRGDGILKDHLDLRDIALLAGGAAVVRIMLFQARQFFALRAGQQRLVALFHFPHQFAGIELVAILVIVPRAADFRALRGDEVFQFLLPLGRGGFHFHARLRDSLLIRARARGDAVALKVDAAGGNVIQLDDRAAGGGFAAAGFAHQAEDFALFDIEAHVIDGLVFLEVLAQVLHPQQHFVLAIRHLRSPSFSRAFWRFGR